jgi:hypothetical protein
MKAYKYIPLLFLPCVMGCSYFSDDGNNSASETTDVGEALDKRAIEAGIIPDTSNIVFAGRFETRSEMGTDKFCAVKKDGGAYSIGALAVFGPESKCEGQGTAKIQGEKVKINFQGEDSCSFEAEYDGVELRIPGKIPAGCASYCSPRASFSGTSFFLVEQGNENARRALGRDIDRLCP